MPEPIGRQLAVRAYACTLDSRPTSSSDESNFVFDIEQFVQLEVSIIGCLGI